MYRWYWCSSMSRQRVRTTSGSGTATPVVVRWATIAASTADRCEKRVSSRSKRTARSVTSAAGQQPDAVVHRGDGAVRDLGGPGRRTGQQAVELRRILEQLQGARADGLEDGHDRVGDVLLQV